MSNTDSVAFTPLNVAELVTHVGDVPGDRIRLRTPPGTATETDLIRVCEDEKRLCELFDGTLMEKVMGALESLLTAALIEYLRRFVRENDLGIILGPDCLLRYSADRVYLPDISFISWSQDPMREIGKHPIANLHPDLAVEVLSKGNTLREMQNKRHDYFAWGVGCVWELDPRKREMAIFTSPEEFTIVGNSKNLDGGDQLPGFSLPMAKIFEDADRGDRR